jgi:hypothetical protein
MNQPISIRPMRAMLSPRTDLLPITTSQSGPAGSFIPMHLWARLGQQELVGQTGAYHGAEFGAGMPLANLAELIAQGNWGQAPTFAPQSKGAWVVTLAAGDEDEDESADADEFDDDDLDEEEDDFEDIEEDIDEEDLAELEEEFEDEEFEDEDFDDEDEFDEDFEEEAGGDEDDF